jgi:type 1 glutamine amidotransferase
MRTLAAIGLFLFGSMMAPADDKPAKPVKALFLTQSAGFKHGSVTRPEGTLSPAEIAMVQLGQQTGLMEVHCTQDAAADFTQDNLKNYDLVMFYTTGNLPIAEENLKFFYDEWLPAKGHAFVGFHSATDTYHDDKRYRDMIGGTFDGHPWGSGEREVIAVQAPDHPAMKSFGKEFEFNDEIYQYKNWQPEKVRVLMSLDMAKTEKKMPYMVPVSWVKNYGDGRMFYTNLGHNEKTWTDKRFLDHVEGGIRWSLGLAEGDATPNPEVQAELNEKAKQAAKGK